MMNEFENIVDTFEDKLMREVQGKIYIHQQRNIDI